MLRLHIMQNRALLILLFIFACIFFTINTSAANQRSQSPVLIYYANETSEAVSTSNPYARLLALLESTKSEKSEQLKTAIQVDAERFPEIVEQDIAHILEFVNDQGIAAVFLTNKFALQNYFLFYDPVKQDLDKVTFPSIELPVDSLLSFSPLSQPNTFEALFVSIASLENIDLQNVTLITKSHGDSTRAIIPRVLVNLTADTEKSFLTALNGEEIAREYDKEWLLNSGIDKLQYWRIIKDMSERFDMYFNIIFLESCQSGVIDIFSALTIPNSVDVIAHTDNNYISFGEVNYGDLLKPLNPEEPIWLAFADRLVSIGVLVETKQSIITRLSWVIFWRYLPYALFIPGIIWIVLNYRETWGKFSRTKT